MNAPVGATLVVARFVGAGDGISGARSWSILNRPYVRREQGDHKGRPYIILAWD